MIIMIIIMISSRTVDTVVDPLSNAPSKSRVYDYLADKVYIQNPSILKFIDSTLYYVTLNPPVYYHFLDLLNTLYKYFFLYTGKTVVDDNCEQQDYWNRNILTVDALQCAEDAIATFQSLKFTTPYQMLSLHHSQEIVLRAILTEQLRVLANKTNHANFDQKSMTRWYIDRPSAFGWLR